MKKINYYDITNLLSTNAQYMMLLGQRSNGKSYQVKKTVLEEACKNGFKFVYLRRWQEDIKAKSVQAYFADMPISKLTKGEYTGITCWNGNIYYTLIDEEGKEVKAKEIGRYLALNELERYKSQAFPEYKYIVYEEFITNKYYLDNEPRELQQMVSTILRLNEGTVFLIGNTLSRVCPYFVEWCLDGVLKQKLGTIELYHYHTQNSDGTDSQVTIAVEYCANVNNDNKMFFGQSSKQIISGEWDTVDAPKLPQELKYYEILYELKVVYQKFSFCMQLLAESYKGGYLVYIYPFTGNRKIERVISDVFSDNIMTSARLDTRRRPELVIAECFQNNKVCYSDNLTAADFKNVNNNFNIVKLF